VLITVCVVAAVMAVVWTTYRLIRASRQVDQILREELDPPGRPADRDQEQPPAGHTE
jgi:hypothetical protein